MAYTNVPYSHCHSSTAARVDVFVFVKVVILLVWYQNNWHHAWQDLWWSDQKLVWLVLELKNDDHWFTMWLTEWLQNLFLFLLLLFVFFSPAFFFFFVGWRWQSCLLINMSNLCLVAQIQIKLMYLSSVNVWNSFSIYTLFFFIFFCYNFFFCLCGMFIHCEMVWDRYADIGNLKKLVNPESKKTWGFDPTVLTSINLILIYLYV